MNTLSIPVIALAFLSLYVGIFYLWMYIKRRAKEELFFGLSCFTIAAYDVFSAGLYSTLSVETAVFWQRHQFASIILLTITVLWFVYYFDSMYVTYPKMYNLLRGMTLFLLVYMFVTFTIHNEFTITPDNPAVKNFMLFGTLQVVYLEAQPGVLYLVQYLFIFLLFVAVLGLALVRIRQGHSHLRPVMAGLLLFFITTVNDILVGAGLYNFIYLAEYGYMFLIVSMSWVLLNRFITLYEKSENMNIFLENQVNARTEELQTALDELEELNESLTRNNRLLEDYHTSSRRDLSMAENVQRTMMPQGPPGVVGWETHIVYLPLAGVSGDLYDFYCHNQVLQGVSLFDVSGHGVSSGLITLLAKSIAYQEFMNNQDQGLVRVIENVADSLRDEIGAVNHFLSGIMLKMYTDDEGTGRVEYVNAGHPDLVIWKASSRQASPVGTGNGTMEGTLLGIADIKGDFNSATVDIEPGDCLFLFTDGIRESINQGKEMFTMDLICRTLEECCTKEKARDILDGFMDRFRSFMGGTSPADDITIILLKKI